MGHRTYSDVLQIDFLKQGDDPTYIFEEHVHPDVWYLGLAGEHASEIKCSKITLPMLSFEGSVKLYNKLPWEDTLKKALKEAISLRAQKHVSNFKEACREFSKEMFNLGVEDQECGIWFANAETSQTLNDKARFQSDPTSYYINRRGLTLDLPNKVIAIIPSSGSFGVVAVNETDKVYNLAFIQNMIFVYYLKELEID